MISVIAAIDEKRGVGKDNNLLFKLSADFKRMKDLSTGHPIIMGMKTYLSIGRILPNRTNIIVTHNPQFQVENGVIVHSLEEAIEKAKESPGSDEIIIFGGGQVWKEAFEKDLVDVLHLTLVKGDYGADTFFPQYEDKFKKVQFREEGKEGDYEYTFLDLTR